MLKKLNFRERLIAAGVAVTAVASQASAALTAPTIATTDFETVAGAVLIAAAVMWSIKKAMGLLRA
ncbi:hypothetical protein [Sulfurimonas sp.]|uniref:hypothetical protein n=1 Tax=Sulfurimonas sp. TaxID=2022749 RepID=UPI002626FCC1|nr:hypothetical protein [Sulfurimonas sp.]MDD5157786.1 hypothetical protein [Sulfurimonas sp.]